MSSLKTLRSRFALWTSGLLLVVLSAFGAYLYLSVANGLYATLDADLALNAAHVLDGLDVAQNGTYTLPEAFLQLPENATWMEPGFTVRIRSPQGLVLQTLGRYQATSAFPNALVAQPEFAMITDPESGAALRVYSMQAMENGQRLAIIQVAQPLQEARNTLDRLLVTLLISVPLLVAAAGAGGYWLAARALAPIDRITSTARRISSQDLSARLNLPATDDEVGRLAQTFDAMLARLDASFQRERQFTADAAHELRTPLTAMKAILDAVRQRQRTPDDYEQALADLDEENHRLRTLSENMLRLVGGDNPTSHQLVDLSALLLDVVDSLRPLAETNALTLTACVDEGLLVHGDSDELVRLFVNLMDNAIKYTQRGGVTISAGRDRDSEQYVRVQVSDTGIGIAAEHLPKIFDRFFQANQSRSRPGAGLGLAIALSIARAHGGEISAQSGANSGSTFTARLLC